MKVALAQINASAGDVRGNLAKISEFARRARGLGAELAVFPEQSLAGYPALDLWEERGFVKENLSALKSLCRGSGEMALLVGFVARNPRRTGKPVCNAAALLHRGRVAAIRAKSLLPTYDVFDEARYFEPAASNPPIRFKGVKLGVTICEDAWAQDRTGERRLYPRDPVRRQVAEGAELLINLSASPFERGKSARRLKLLSAHARKAGMPLLYCNMIGGNDELIFDGQSLAFDARGRVAARGKAFEEDLLLVDTQALRPLGGPIFLGEIEEVRRALVLGIRDYARKCGFTRVFVGLSGGIDSALTCALAVDALGAGGVTGVAMPSMYSSRGSLADARALALNLGIRFLTLPISPIFQAYRKTLGKILPAQPEGLAEQNIQARIRGSLLMALTNREGGLLLSTGNKSELAAGYCTLYGDMSGGLAVLADVPKGTVYELSRWINRGKPVIPRNSIDKAPSAELKPNQKDQDDLPPYDVLDSVLTAYVEGRHEPEEIARKGFDRALVEDILGRIDRSEYKRRQAPPCLKISPKAFGVGRRMPIARGSHRR